MSNLLEIAETAWRQLNPNPNDETAITKEEVISTAKTEYAYQVWRRSKEEQAQEGGFNIPSYLLTEVELDVVDNEMDISGLKVLKALSDDSWLQNVGGIGCDCVYVKSNINLAQLLCDDDSLGDGVKTYYVLGSKIKLPRGAHKKKLPVTYANMGEKINNRIEIDDSLGKMVRDYLIAVYSGKTGNEDTTNNSSSKE